MPYTVTNETGQSYSQSDKLFDSKIPEKGRVSFCTYPHNVLTTCRQAAQVWVRRCRTIHHAAYYKLVSSFFEYMAELTLVDYFVMGEAVGIVATLFVSFYFSRKQMQKLSIDIETKVLSDLDEKIHNLTQMAVEKPQLIRIVSNVNESDLTEEIAFTYHLLHTFAHVYHMYQRKVVSDNEWTGWIRMMRSCFEQGKVREYWESDLELEREMV